MRYVYLFHEGNARMKELLGGKGANLAEMTNIGLPVPCGMTITTDACREYYNNGKKLPEGLVEEVTRNLKAIEEEAGKRFGDEDDPLLLSVRSGAVFSMPGMMDTILNLGLNEDVVAVIAEKSNNPRWAWDCYRRFIQMYSDVVMEVGKKYFEQLIDEMKSKKGVTQDVELTAEDLKELAGQFKAEYKAKVAAENGTAAAPAADNTVDATVIVEALGGKDNILKVTNCYTRLRTELADPDKVQDDVLKNQTGASAVIHKGKNVQVVYGLKVNAVRKAVDAELGLSGEE